MRCLQGLVSASILPVGPHGSHRELPLPARPADYARLQRNHRDLVADILTSDWTIKASPQHGWGMYSTGAMGAVSPMSSV